MPNSLHSKIIYLKSEDVNPSTDIIKKLENDARCIISLCDSWMSLVSRLMESSDKVPILLVDIKMFEKTDSTVNEIINMILTLYRCIDKNMKLILGVVAEKETNPTILRSLKETEIIGIVPCPRIFGYDKTLLALSHILSGRRYWPRDVIDMIIGKISCVKNSNIILTDRQNQIMNLVCNRGLSNKKIAQALKISESTVKIHVSAILKKYCVRNRTQLVLAAKSSLSV